MAPQTFLLEIGTEELPADFVRSAIAQWQEYIPCSLGNQSLSPESLKVYGTPRRLAVYLTGLPSRQPDRTETLKGPAFSAAYHQGEPTPALMGFVKKQGVELEDLEVQELEKGAFVFARKHLPGQSSFELLPDLVLSWLNHLEGRRFMRWGDGELRFPRPIRWLVALLDEQILPVQWLNGSSHITSDRQSRGHRTLHPAPVILSEAQNYAETMRSAFVIVDPQERENLICRQIEAQAQTLGAKAEIFPDLLSEVVQLVEYPTAVLGGFEEEFLQLPPEVITTVMVTHQRYFPVKSSTGNLLPHFITISNGDPQHQAVIAAGNGRVIRARLADASFFYHADCDQPLESYLPQLETVTFQEELGSMRDKVDRIMELTQAIATQLQLPYAQRNDIESTAMLCKADLVTQMVYEFPELQGIMGEKYALASREDEEVAKAIFEHYLPRNADDILPTTLTGKIVGLADRLDTLISIFGLGLIPSGSSDPFALRRAANAIVNITWVANLPINLEYLLEYTATSFAHTFNKDAQSLISILREFFIQRIRTLLQEEKHIDYDLVNAVLGEQDPEYIERALQDLLDIRDRATYLQQIRHNGTLEKIYETINRSTRLAAQGDLDLQQLIPDELINPTLFQKSSETALYQALVALVPQTQLAQQTRNYQLLIAALEKIAPTVSQFFDGEDSVLVMDPDPHIKRNRLNLLGLLRNHGRILADFGAIVKNL